MIGALMGLPGKLKTLTDRLSAVWAAKLDTLATNYTAARAAKLDNLSVNVNTLATAAGLANVAYPSSQMSGIIKSVQHFMASVATGTGTSVVANIPITAVANMAKTVLIMNGWAPNDTDGYGGRIKLTATNQVTFYFFRATSVNSIAYVGFTVVEFY